MKKIRLIDFFFKLSFGQWLSSFLYIIIFIHSFKELWIIELVNIINYHTRLYHTLCVLWISWLKTTNPMFRGF